MSDTLDRIVPEAGPKGEALYRHDAEGICSVSQLGGGDGGTDGGHVQDPTISRRTSSRR